MKLFCYRTLILAFPTISISALLILWASQEPKADHLSVMPVCGRLQLLGSFLRALEWLQVLSGKATGIHYLGLLHSLPLHIGLQRVSSFREELGELSPLTQFFRNFLTVFALHPKEQSSGQESRMGTGMISSYNRGCDT